MEIFFVRIHMNLLIFALHRHLNHCKILNSQELTNGSDNASHIMHYKHGNLRNNTYESHNYHITSMS